MQQYYYFYRNYVSGNSAILNLLADKIGAERNAELFKDVIYNQYGEIHPLDDSIKAIKISTP